MLQNESTVTRVVLASSFGSLMEWYDFVLGNFCAALVWPIVFFPRVNPMAAFALSVSVFASSFFMRPVGSFIFGHFGDKRGRKKVLVWTLMTMGIGSIGIALTPPYAEIGILGAVLILVFRLLQGVGVGGEWGGAASWLVEYVSSSKMRGFLTGLINVVAIIGSALSALGFALLSGLLTKQSFLNWGWRIPYFIGTAVLVIGILIRYRTADSPIFIAAQEKKATVRLPGFQVIKEQWRKILLLSPGFFYVGTITLTFQVFGLGYIAKLGVSHSFGAFAISAGSMVAVPVMLMSGYLTDKIGRKTVIVVGIILAVGSIIAFFPLVDTLNSTAIVFAFILTQSCGNFGYAALPALFTEQFPTKYRYSGSGLSGQLGTVFSGIVLGMILPLIVVMARGLQNAVPYIIMTSIVVCLISLSASFFVRETRGVVLENSL
ncbi:MAG: MFS transporter [Nitrososphaerota archaeon]|nr:MFS transporter [Nitrososphaerota archaeon]